MLQYCAWGLILFYLLKDVIPAGSLFYITKILSVLDYYHQFKFYYS